MREGGEASFGGRRKKRRGRRALTWGRGGDGKIAAVRYALVAVRVQVS